MQGGDCHKLGPTLECSALPLAQRGCLSGLAMESWPRTNAFGEEHVAGDLADAPGWKQYLHSLYFTVTICATVGFGDITAQMDGEVHCVALGQVGPR
jgi:hypothetical protein